MKKIILIFSSILFVLLPVSTLTAQVLEDDSPSEAGDISFGVRGGLTLYSIETEVSGGLFGNISETSDNKLGFALGVFAEIPLTPIFSFQPELLFVQKGGSEGSDPFDDDDFFDDDDDVLDEGGSLTFNYLDIPLLARANIPIEADFSPYVVAGPSIGYLLSASASAGDDEDIEEFFKSYNFSFVLGAGVDFGNLSVDLRYDIGLTNILDDSFLEDEFDDDDDLGDFFDDLFSGIEFTQKTSGIILSVGYRF